MSPLLRRVWIALATVLVVSGCASSTTTPKKTRWDQYYAQTDTPRARVKVVPPEGTTVPMANLIAEYVAEHLRKEDISADVSAHPRPGGRYYVLTGYAEDKRGDPRVSYTRILHWLLSDSNGRLISTYAHGVEGSDQQWNFGDAQLLASIGIGTAGPVSQMVRQEVRAKVPVDPTRRGLLIEEVTGLPEADAKALTQAMAEALRTSDLLATGDPRQAVFRLAGHVNIQPGPDGVDEVKIVWRVLTMDRQEVGSAVQDNRVAAGSLAGRWAAVAPAIAKAAVVGVEHVFGTRAGPPPGSPDVPQGPPPTINLPGQPGRAMPPPQ